MMRLQVQRRTATAPSQQGMALIAVLWLVAALSLMVTGVSGVVRQEAKMVGIAKDKVTAQAVGDAAVVMVLQQLSADRTILQETTETSVNYQGAQVAVSGLFHLQQPETAIAAVAAQAGLRVQRLPGGALVVW